MARKATDLERAILDLYYQLDAATPEMHKQAARKGGSSATESPWVNLYQAGCGLVMAAVELGNHCRRAAGDEKPGPVHEALGDEALRRIRDHVAAASGGDMAGEEAKRLFEALRAAGSDFPDRVDIQSEVEWVAANLHDPCPVMETAPSRMAISLLLDARRDERVRREFWTIMLSKRLSPGDSRPRATAFEDDMDADDDMEAEDEDYDEALEQSL